MFDFCRCRIYIVYQVLLNSPSPKKTRRWIPKKKSAKNICYTCLKKPQNTVLSIAVPFGAVYSCLCELHKLGAIAQLGERSVRNAEVGGSTPLRSIFVSSTSRKS